MNKVKTVDGFTFPLTFRDAADFLYEAYYDDTGFWFIAVKSGNVYREYKWDFSVFKSLVEKGDWVIGLQSTPPKDPLVTIPESEYHSLIEEVNMLQELVKELSAPQDTALEQQAETYRALNETLTRHESFQEGEDGVFTSRCEELLNTIDFLHEVYDDWKTNDYRAAVASAGSDAFKPIGEYTLEDWQQAIDEDWKFKCRDGYPVQVVEVNRTFKYPVECTDGLCRDIKGFWCSDKVDEDDIVKRIR